MFRCRTTKFRNLVSLRSRRPAFTRPAFPSKPSAPARVTNRLLLPVLPPLLSQEKVPPRAQGGYAMALRCASAPPRRRFFVARRRARLPRRSATRTIFWLRTSKHCTRWMQLRQVCYTPGRTIFWLRNVGRSLSRTILWPRASQIFWPRFHNLCRTSSRAISLHVPELHPVDSASQHVPI